MSPISVRPREFSSQRDASRAIALRQDADQGAILQDDKKPDVLVSHNL